MAKPRPWTVLDNAPIAKLADNMWHVSGAVPHQPFERHMVLVRLADGRLVIHNGIALNDSDMAEIEAWGEPAFLIVPSGLHRMDCHAYKQRYPNLHVITPTPFTEKVAKKVEVYGGLDALPDDPSLAAVRLAGAKEAVFRVTHGDACSLIFNDLLFNLPDKLPGLGGLVVRLLGSAGGPKVTKLGKRFVVTDRDALRDELDALADSAGLARLVPGHGAVIDEDAPGVLHRVAAAL
jgi:hypothetical protein